MTACRMNGLQRPDDHDRTDYDIGPMLDITVAVVPVAGLGTRLLPATKSQPKEMLPVGRRPVVQYVVEELTEAGIERVLFVTGRGKTSIENHFDTDFELIQSLRESGKEELLAELEFERARVQYFYTRQRETLGPRPRRPLRAAVRGRRCRSWSPSATRSSAWTGAARSCGAWSSASWRRRRRRWSPSSACRASEVRHYGIARPRGEGDVFEVADVVEKPSPEDAPSDLAIAGRYVFAPSIFDALQRTSPGKGGEIQLTDAIRIAIREGGRVYGMCLSDERAPLRRRQLRQLLPRLRGVRAGRPESTGRPCARPCKRLLDAPHP